VDAARLAGASVITVSTAFEACVVRSTPTSRATSMAYGFTRDGLLPAL
jgi:hypothetical protein